MERQQPREKKFSDVLRAFRERADIGISRLANMTNISKGYLSDVENDKVPPPSVEKIEAIASVLNCDIWALLRAAGREIEYIARQPAAADFLRKTGEFTSEDWKKAGQLVDLAGLGKGGKRER